MLVSLLIFYLTTSNKREKLRWFHGWLPETRYWHDNRWQMIDDGLVCLHIRNHVSSPSWLFGFFHHPKSLHKHRRNFIILRWNFSSFNKIGKVVFPKTWSSFCRLLTFYDKSWRRKYFRAKRRIFWRTFPSWSCRSISVPVSEKNFLIKPFEKGREYF